jgi:hypothetical protein
MSNNIFTSLPSLLDDSEERKASILQPIHAAFFIPKLENKPQDPIIDSLDLDSTRGLREVLTNGMANGKLPTVNGHDALSQRPTVPMNAVEDERGGDNIWMIAASGSDAHGVSNPSQQQQHRIAISHIYSRTN